MPDLEFSAVFLNIVLVVKFRSLQVSPTKMQKVVKLENFDSQASKPASRSADRPAREKVQEAQVSISRSARNSFLELAVVWS